jgi:hypothetical protein
VWLLNIASAVASSALVVLCPGALVNFDIPDVLPIQSHYLQSLSPEIRRVKPPSEQFFSSCLDGHHPFRSAVTYIFRFCAPSGYADVQPVFAHSVM